MIPPSFYAHVFGGVSALVAIVLILMYGSGFSLRERILFLLALSIAVGIHGISHQGLELAYGYYPWGV